MRRPPGRILDERKSDEPLGNLSREKRPAEMPSTPKLPGSLLGSPAVESALPGPGDHLAITHDGGGVDAGVESEPLQLLRAFQVKDVELAVLGANDDPRAGDHRGGIDLVAGREAPEPLACLAVDRVDTVVPAADNNVLLGNRRRGV